MELPLTSVTEEYKVGKARLIMILKDSKDEKVRMQVNAAGRKLSGSKAVEEAKNRLKHREIVGAVCMGREVYKKQLLLERGQCCRQEKPHTA